MLRRCAPRRRNRVSAATSGIDNARSRWRMPGSRRSRRRAPIEVTVGVRGCNHATVRRSATRGSGVVENWHNRAFTSFGDGHGVWEKRRWRAAAVLRAEFPQRDAMGAADRSGAARAHHHVAPGRAAGERRGWRSRAAPPTAGTERKLGVTPDRIQSHGLDLSKATSSQADRPRLGGGPQRRGHRADRREHSKDEFEPRSSRRRTSASPSRTVHRIRCCS